MNEQEHYLVCLAEECVEAALEADKVLRFGLADHAPGRQVTNEYRLLEELSDLACVVRILQEDGVLRSFDPLSPLQADVDAKRAKIRKYMQVARANGTLTPW